RWAWAGEHAPAGRGDSGSNREAAPGALRGLRADAGVREAGGGARSGREPGHAGRVVEGTRAVGASAASGPAPQASRASVVLRIDGADGWVAPRLGRGPCRQVRADGLDR